MSGPPPRSLTLIAFRPTGNVPSATFSQVLSAEVAPVAPLWVTCDLVPWCINFWGSCVSARMAHSSLDPLPLVVTFYRIMCSDVGTSRIARRAGLGVIFPCSPAGAGGHLGLVCWVAPLGPPCVRLVGKRGQAGRQVCAGVPFPFLDADGIGGRGERGPCPGYVGGMGSVGPSG